MQDFKISFNLTCPSLANLLGLLLSFGFNDTFHNSALNEIDKIINPNVALA